MFCSQIRSQCSKRECSRRLLRAIERIMARLSPGTIAWSWLGQAGRRCRQNWLRGFGPRGRGGFLTLPHHRAPAGSGALRVVGRAQLREVPRARVRMPLETSRRGRIGRPEPRQSGIGFWRRALERRAYAPSQARTCTRTAGGRLCSRARQAELVNFAPRACDLGRGGGVAASEPPEAFVEGAERRARLQRADPCRVRGGGVSRSPE